MAGLQLQKFYKMANSILNKEHQKKETKKEILNLIKDGAILVSLEEYKKIFKRYGFTICFDPKNYLLKYYNTSNKQHYLEATTTFLDRSGKSFANINGEWYKKHVTKHNRSSQEYKDFRNDRNTYFTVLKSGHILTI